MTFPHFYVENSGMFLYHYSMKQVLLIDTDNNFRDFLKEKLAEYSVHVESCTGILNAHTKTLKLLPDAIIVETDSIELAMPFLLQKRKDPNAKKIPIILLGKTVEKERITDLILLGVVNYFKRPVKIDIILEALGRILGFSASLDTTPCVMNMHINGKVLFIELAKGLNREKISMMRHKIPDFIKDIDTDRPKIIVMLTDMELSFLDAPNLEFLLDSLIESPKILRPNVKILSLSDFVRELVEGHEEYAGIKVVRSLAEILGTLDKGLSSSASQEKITEKILVNEIEKEESYETRFVSDTISRNDIDKGILFHAAIVDDQAIFRNILKNSLSTIGCEAETFESGEDFLAAINEKIYDLIILDIFMPGLSGLDVLIKLAEKQTTMPVIIYSQAIQREAVMKSLQLGAKAYLVKPQKPETILAKCVEILRNEGLQDAH